MIVASATQKTALGSAYLLNHRAAPLASARYALVVALFNARLASVSCDRGDYERNRACIGVASVIGSSAARLASFPRVLHFLRNFTPGLRRLSVESKRG